jgi:signal transduction histidine kinase
MEETPIRLTGAVQPAPGPRFPLARAQVVSIQEELCHRIASDIHDDTLQVMAEVAIRLDMLRTSHPELDLEVEFGELGSSVRAAMDRLRTLTFELAPADLEAQGIGSTIRRLLDVMEERNRELVVRLDDGLRSQPTAQVRMALYRIAQEALTNVRKHAYAHTVEIVLEDVSGGVLMRIADDGRGFRPSESPAGHRGLSLMRERAETEGGWLRLLSAPGAGACIECWLPNAPDRTE